MKYFIVILLFIFSLNLFSQKKVKIEFKYPLSDNVSFDVGKEIAIQKAKEEALRKGGIGENIKSFSTLSKTQNNKDFKSIFSSDIFAEITGFCEITEWIKYPEKFFNEEENAYYINLSFMAKISKYDSKPDPQFVMQVEGLKVGYKSNNDNNQENNLNLRIIPSMDCYLKIFYLTDDKTSIVYPIETTERVSQNPEFKDEILIANKEKLVNYIEPVTDKKIELGKLIFVITKKKYDYSSAVAEIGGLRTKTFLDEIYDWYMSIEPDEKYIIYQQFSIQR